jgi:HlyD family secretion protein
MKIRASIPVVLISIAVLGAAVVAAWWFLVRQPPLPEGLIQANGRIEGDNYLVAAKVAGRVSEMHAREGDQVTKGQVLLRLDDAQMRAKQDQAQQAVNALGLQLKASQTAISVLKQEVPLEVAAADAALAQAQAQLSSARANEKQAKRDVSRFRELAKAGTVDQHRHEQMELAWSTARNQRIAAQQAVNMAEKRLAQANLGQARIQAKQEEVAALAAQRDQAKAALAEVRSVLDELVVRAPAAGIITTRMVDVGEVVAAGTPMFDIVDLDRLYLKVYVPEVQIGKVHRNLPARIYTDAFPDQPFPAVVRYISSRAAFTPKEVQTQDERVKLVYAVHLYLEKNPDHRLTPGLPADAVIRWQEGASWAKPLR